MKSFVLGVELDNQYKAYPVSIFENDHLVYDEIGTISLLLVAAYDNDYIQIFNRNVEGPTLTFVSGKTNDYFLDNEIRS